MTGLETALGLALVGVCVMFAFWWLGRRFGLFGERLMCHAEDKYRPCPHTIDGEDGRQIHLCRVDHEIISHMVNCHWWALEVLKKRKDARKARERAEAEAELKRRAELKEAKKEAVKEKKKGK